MSSLVKYVEDNLITKKEFPSFSSGDTITVYYEIKEGSKTRTQFFKGIVLQRKGSGSSETFTIRKMSGSIGVERIFPINSPALNKIEINKKGKVRRSKIFYFRNLTGKKAKIKFMPMQPGDVAATWADTRLLECLTGYRQTTNIEVGVARFVDWYRDYYSIKDY